MTASIVVLLLLLAYGGLFFGQALVGKWFPPLPPAPPPALVVAHPIQTVTFSDGSALTISAVADSEIVCGTTKGANDGGQGIGFNNHLDVMTYKNDGKVVYEKFSASPGTLLVACRLLDSSGIAIRPYRYHIDGSVYFRDGIRAEFPGWQAMESPIAKDAKLPDVFVQLSDGAGAWLDGSGPICAPDDPEKRGFIAFSAWPQSIAELEFRAIRPGQPSVFWKMKNTLRSTLPAAWTPDTLPKVYTAPEFELEFLGTTTPVGKPNTMQPLYRFVSRVPGDSQRQGFEISYQCACVELLGALGTRSQPNRVPSSDASPPATFQLPPDETMLRFRFVVSPSYYFPYRRDEAVILLKCKVSADGKSIALAPSKTPGDELVSANFEYVECINEGVGSFSLNVKYAQEGTTSKITKASPVCFIGNEEISSGYADGGINGYSNAHGRSLVQMNIRWNGRAKPGDEITVGMITPRQPSEVIFTTPRPAR